jgi:hypothetical protein
MTDNNISSGMANQAAQSIFDSIKSNQGENYSPLSISTVAGLTGTTAEYVSQYDSDKDNEISDDELMKMAQKMASASESNNIVDSHDATNEAVEKLSKDEAKEATLKAIKDATKGVARIAVPKAIDAVRDAKGNITNQAAIDARNAEISAANTKNITIDSFNDALKKIQDEAIDAYVALDDCKSNSSYFEQLKKIDGDAKAHPPVLSISAKLDELKMKPEFASIGTEASKACEDLKEGLRTNNDDGSKRAGSVYRYRCSVQVVLRNIFYQDFVAFCKKFGA